MSKRARNLQELFPDAGIITIGSYEPIPDPAGIRIMAGGVDITAEILSDLTTNVRAMPDYPSERRGHPTLERVRAIGRDLHEQGGLSLMQAVFYRVQGQLGREGRSVLEWAWDGVGEWQP